LKAENSLRESAAPDDDVVLFCPYGIVASGMHASVSWTKGFIDPEPSDEAFDGAEDNMAGMRCFNGDGGDSVEVLMGTGSSPVNQS
jgi:hypothetical protein